MAICQSIYGIPIRKMVRIDQKSWKMNLNIMLFSILMGYGN